MSYVYLVKNKTTNLKYIGAKYAKGATPAGFWVNYFTSSKTVHKLIDQYGVDDFSFRVLKVFNTRSECLEFERYLISKTIKRKDYINYSTNFYTGSSNKEEELHSIAIKRGQIQGTLSYLNKTGIFAMTEEERLAACSKGGKTAAIINKKLGRAIFDPEVRERQHKTLRENQVSAYYDPELRTEISSKGGKNGLFSKAYAERNNLTEEDMRKAQSERGKKGGVKNKGFKWYTDGEKSFKYTASQQKELPFEEFLKQNTQFKKGRTLKSLKGSIFYNDGTKEKMYSPDEQKNLSFEEFLRKNPQFKKGRIK